MLEGNTVPIAITLAVLGVVLYLRKNEKKRGGKPYPPSLPALPLVGSLPYVSGGMDVLPQFFMKTAEKLGPVFTFYAGPRLAVVLNGKAAVADAMLKHAESFADKPGFWTEANIFNPELKGLAFAHYTELFKRSHRVTLSVLKEMGNGIAQVTEERIMHQIELMFAEFRKQCARPFDPKPVLIKTASSVVLSVLFGQRFRSGSGHKSVVENACDYVENMDPAIDMAPLLRFLPKYRKKISIMQRTIVELMKGLDDGVQQSKLPDSEYSLVKRYIEIEGPDYDHQNLLYILRDFCLGGTETTASTVLWTLLELANHPEKQVRLQREIDEVITGNRLPSLADKHQLPYAEAIIMETSRRHTVVPLSLPHATLNDTETCGYFVPKGSLVMVNIYSVHMDKDTWTDPENFRPERFLDDNNKLINKEKIIPYGQGKRSCVAELLGRQELFLVITSIAQNFHIRVPEGLSSISVKDKCGLTVTPSSFEVSLIERRRNSISDEEFFRNFAKKLQGIATDTSRV